MKNKLKKIDKYHVLLLLIMLSAVVLLLVLTSKKEGMHVDEYLTYGLANHEFNINGSWKISSIVYGARVAATDVYDEYFYPNHFSISNVWLNQGDNVHPPLFYLLFHIFILVTHHFLGLKTGVLLQIIFHIINIMLVWMIIKEMLSEKYEALLGTILYAFLPIVLGNVLFIRMYVMLSGFILALTLLFVKAWNQTDRKAFYIKLGLLSVLGTLTHYYFLIYLFYCCVVWGIRILSKRRWKELAAFLVTMTVSGIVSIAIFPYMLKHLFLGSAGERSINNVFSLSALKQNIPPYLEALYNVFGGYLPIVLVVVAAVLIYRYVIWNGGNENRSYLGRWAILFIPCILYLLTVTKIAIIPAARYITPSYAICIILLIGLFDKISSSLTNRDWVKWLSGSLMVGILLNNSYNIYTWPELYTEAKECIETARKYGVNNECIYVFKASGYIYPAYQEFIQYQNVTFIQEDMVDMLYAGEYSDYEHVVMYFDEHVDQEKVDEILDHMIEMNQGLERYEKLHKYSYNTAYYLE